MLAFSVSIYRVAEAKQSFEIVKFFLTDDIPVVTVVGQSGMKHTAAPLPMKRGARSQF